MMIPSEQHDEISADRDSADAARPALSLRSILLLHDRPEPPSPTIHALRSAGFNVLTAQLGLGQPSTWTSTNPDLAVINIDGPISTAASAIRAMRNSSCLPTVIHAQSPATQAMTDILNVQPCAFVQKTPDSTALLLAVQIAFACHLELLAARKEIGALKQRLEDRKLIEQAKWILVKRRGLDEPDALRLLQKQARNNRKPLVDIARSVIQSQDMLIDSSSQQSTDSLR